MPTCTAFGTKSRIKVTFAGRGSADGRLAEAEDAPVRTAEGGEDGPAGEELPQ